MRPQLLFRKIHKWFGLILGIQILFWFASGFLMSFMPIDEIRGDHLLQPQTKATIELKQIDLHHIEAQVDEPILSTEIKSWLKQTVVVVKTKQTQHLFNAKTAERISPLSEQLVTAVLGSRLKPGLEIIGMQLLDSLPNEVRGRKAPLWQVQLNGSENPHIYVSAQSGEIVAKRTDRWRLFDFMWMLHIMDYDERSDFNHPLLYLTAFSALLFTLTGFILLFFKLRPSRKPSS